ncbi:hypothetical protein VNO77_34208 [Canavalia gladiata]|uniref:Uncharacterized protein n=1 Tax=Canavalia gladiata TaxID=3824 RepID=A0AAN9KDX5_CANGL
MRWVPLPYLHGFSWLECGSVWPRGSDAQALSPSPFGSPLLHAFVKDQNIFSGATQIKPLHGELHPFSAPLSVGNRICHLPRIMRQVSEIMGLHENFLGAHGRALHAGHVAFPM